MKIGLYGGTFNPIHNGHVALAEEVRAVYNLDEIWFIPAGNSPFKLDEVDMATAQDRLIMTTIAAAALPYAKVLDIEVNSNVSYTADTLKLLSKLDNDYYLIMGADAFATIEKWERHEYLLTNAKFIVAGRDGVDIVPLAAKLKKKYKTEIHQLVFDMPISSTIIREHLEGNRELLNPMVYEYVKTYDLYKKGE